MKKSILLISHSKKITDGLKEMIEEMSSGDTVTLYSLGGTPEGALGTDPMKIMEALQQTQGTMRLVFCDIGSAIMSAEMAVEMLSDEEKKDIHLMDAPLIEGAFAAAITGGFSDDVEQILAEAQTAAKKNFEN